MKNIEDAGKKKKRGVQKLCEHEQASTQLIFASD